MHDPPGPPVSHASPTIPGCVAWSSSTSELYPPVVPLLCVPFHTRAPGTSNSSARSNLPPPSQLAWTRMFREQGGQWVGLSPGFDTRIVSRPVTFVTSTDACELVLTSAGLHCHGVNEAPPSVLKASARVSSGQGPPSERQTVYVEFPLRVPQACLGK